MRDFQNSLLPAPSVLIFAWSQLRLMEEGRTSLENCLDRLLHLLYSTTNISPILVGTFVTLYRWRLGLYLLHCSPLPPSTPFFFFVFSVCNRQIACALQIRTARPRFFRVGHYSTKISAFNPIATTAHMWQPGACQQSPHQRPTQTNIAGQ